MSFVYTRRSSSTPVKSLGQEKKWVHRSGSRESPLRPDGGKGETFASHHIREAGLSTSQIRGREGPRFPPPYKGRSQDLIWIYKSKRTGFWVN